MHLTISSREMQARHSVSNTGNSSKSFKIGLSSSCLESHLYSSYHYTFVCINQHSINLPSSPFPATAPALDNLIRSLNHVPLREGLNSFPIPSSDDWQSA